MTDKIIIKHDEVIKVNNHGNKKFLQYWCPENEVVGVICLVHGLGEHSGRYINFAQDFVENNYAVLAIDLYGHGKSDGLRGHIESYTILMDDILFLLEEAQERFTDIPLYLYGHSMGGNLVLNYSIRYKPKIKGLIVSAPWLRLAQPPPPGKLFLGWVMNYLWPSFTQSNGINPADLSHDKEINNKYKKDPLDHDKISAGLFVKIYQSGKWAIEHASELEIPVLIMHGAADKITSPEASEEFADRVLCKSTYKKWIDLYHEIHNESEWSKVFSFILGWLKMN